MVQTKKNIFEYVLLQDQFQLGSIRLAALNLQLVENKNGTKKTKLRFGCNKNVPIQYILSNNRSKLRQRTNREKLRRTR